MRTWTLLITMTVLASVAAGQECPPAIAGRLAAAGVPEGEVPAVCTAATALIGHAVVVDARGELLDDLVRVILPFGTQIVLEDARYCRATGPHAAELIAAATEGSVSPGESLTAADCDAPLSSIAARIKPPEPGGWAVVARMTLQWSPWRLSLTATDAMQDGLDPARWPELRASLLGPEHEQVVETSAASFPTPAGALPALSSKAAFYFSDTSFAIAIVPGAVVEDVPEDAPLPPLRAIAGARDPVAGANASLIFGHEALNRFAAEFLAQTPIPVQTDSVPPGGEHRQVVGLANLTGLRVEGTKDAYTIHGDLRQSDGGYLAKIVLHPDATGDLVIHDVRFSPMRGDCSDSFDLLTCLQLVVRRNGKALAANIAARDILGEKPWLSFLEQRELELPWGGAAAGLRGSIRRISSDEEALVLSGDLRLRKR